MARVEAKAGLFETILSGKSIKPVLTGYRAWVPLTSSRFLSHAFLDGNMMRVEAVSPRGEETILYECTRMRLGIVSLEQKIEATGDEINNPRMPWHGRIRRVDP